MSLKSKTITIDDGRDAGKSFVITEMPILKADAWATRAIFAIAKSGQDASSIDATSGMLGMAKFAFSAIGGIDPEVGKQLLDELLECVQFIPSSGTPRSLSVATDIKDIKTLYILRKEAFLIHVDFLIEGSS